MSAQQLQRQLDEIARRVTPCPAPDVAAGWDLCAHEMPWPCSITEAAWIARGLDRDDQVQRQLAGYLEHGEARTEDRR